MHYRSSAFTALATDDASPPSCNRLHGETPLNTFPELWISCAAIEARCTSRLGSRQLRSKVLNTASAFTALRAGRYGKAQCNTPPRCADRFIHNLTAQHTPPQRPTRVRCTQRRVVSRPVGSTDPWPSRPQRSRCEKMGALRATPGAALDACSACDTRAHTARRAERHATTSHGAGGTRSQRRSVHRAAVWQLQQQTVEMDSQHTRQRAPKA